MARGPNSLCRLLPSGDGTVTASVRQLGIFMSPPEQVTAETRPRRALFDAILDLALASVFGHEASHMEMGKPFCPIAEPGRGEEGGLLNVIVRIQGSGELFAKREVLQGEVTAGRCAARRVRLVRTALEARHSLDPEQLNFARYAPRRSRCDRPHLRVWGNYPRPRLHSCRGLFLSCTASSAARRGVSRGAIRANSLWRRCRGCRAGCSDGAHLFRGTRTTTRRSGAAVPAWSHSRMERLAVVARSIRLPVTKTPAAQPKNFTLSGRRPFTFFPLRPATDLEIYTVPIPLAFAHSKRATQPRCVES